MRSVTTDSDLTIDDLSVDDEVLLLLLVDELELEVEEELED